MGSVMEGALKRNPDIREMYLNMFVKVIFQELVIRTRIPMMHYTLKSRTVCRSINTPSNRGVPVYFKQKCSYLVSYGFLSVKM